MRHWLAPVLLQGRFQGGTLAGRFLGGEPVGAAFDFANDQVLIRGGGLVPDYFGTIQNAIDASVITFTRATNASRVNASGLIETVSSGIWRREYSPTTLLPLGYLPEPSRINIATYSEDFRNTAEAGGSRPWTRNSCTVATANITGPDGTTSATTVTENASGSGQCNAQNTMSFTSGTSYTVSTFQRYIGRRYAQLFFGSAAFGANAYVNFDLTGLTVGTVGSAVTGYGIKDCGNGWVRIWCTAPATATTSSAAVWGHIDSSTAARAPSITLSGLTSGLYGFQVEAGSYPTSYIPTPSSSTVTRNADVMYIDSTKLPWSTSEFAVIAALQPSPDTLATNFNSFTVWGDANNFATVRNGGAGTYRTQLVGNSGGASTLVVTDSSGTYSATRFKVAGAFKANDAQMVRGGVSIGTDVSGAMPVSPTRLYLGTQEASSFGLPWSAPVESLVYIPRRLTAAEMIARTA